MFLDFKSAYQNDFRSILTGVMAAENSALKSQYIFFFLFFLLKHISLYLLFYCLHQVVPW